MTNETLRAFVVTNGDDGFERGPRRLPVTALPEDGVLINVEWSGVNYKDALASTPGGKVARISPLIPGIDLAGSLAEQVEGLAAGAAVLAHGYEIGVSRHGGFANMARVPVEWLVPLPVGLTTREAMVIGTAGFTAALSVIALQEHGIFPEDGPVLVTGATGGVGSVAVNILAGLGYEVIASTGKPQGHDFLRSLGATDIVDRTTLGDSEGRALDTMLWAAAVDCVGGVTLANVLSKIRYGGAVAASGVTGGARLPTTVMPFILRGISLLGIDSVQTPIDHRRKVWGRLASDLKPRDLERIGNTIEFDHLGDVLSAMLDGAVTGRNVVSCGPLSAADASEGPGL